MPRVKKINESISEEDLNKALNFAYNFMDFSKGYQDSTGILSNTRFFTPDMVNAQLQNINNNYTFKSADDIEKILQNTKGSEQILRDLAIGFEIENIYYKRLMQFNSDLLAYNLTWDCVNLEDDSFNKNAFQKDLNILKDFIYRFNFKDNFSMCHRQMLRQGAIAVSVRDDYENIILQELPLNFTKIIGRDSYGLLFAFNFMWFIGNYGTDINMYKNVFKSMYMKIYDNISNTYKPTTNNSTYVYWENCKRSDGFWYFKSTPEITTLIPYYSSMFPSLSLQPTIRKLQYNKDVIASTKVILGNIAMLKEQKAGNVTNQMAFDSKAIGQFLGMIRANVAKEIGIGVMPSDGISSIDFDTQDKNIYSDDVESVSNQSVSSSESLISKDKLSLFESKVALDIDSNFAKSFYSMFEKFVEYQVNSKTQKYKFRIRFHDVNTSVDEEKRMKEFSDLAKMGIIRWDLLARGLNENIFEFENKLKYSKYLNLDKYLTPLLSLYNQTGNDVGRAANTNPDSDSTAASQERGSNEE